MATDRAELKNVRKMQAVILLTSLIIVVLHIVQFIVTCLNCRFTKENRYMTLAGHLFKQDRTQFILLLLLIFLFILIVCSYDRMNAFLSQ